MRGSMPRMPPQAATGGGVFVGAAVETCGRRGYRRAPLRTGAAPTCAGVRGARLRTGGRLGADLGLARLAAVAGEVVQLVEGAEDGLLVPAEAHGRRLAVAVHDGVYAQEGEEQGGGALAQGLQVVAALLHRDEPAAAVGVGDL